MDDALKDALSRREKKKLEAYIESLGSDKKAVKEAAEESDEFLSGDAEESMVHFSNGKPVKPLDALDSVTGAPMRRVIAEMQAGAKPGAVKRIVEQVGSDPETAPDWEEIAGNAGVENKTAKKAAGLLGPFLEPGLPKALTKGLGVMGIAAMNPKLKKLDSLADNEKLAEKIGQAKKISEEAVDISDNPFVKEIFETEKGFKRATLKDESGAIVASVLIDDKGKVLHATGSHGKLPEYRLKHLLGDLRPDMHGKDWFEWRPLERELESKSKMRGELKEFDPAKKKETSKDPFAPDAEVIDVGRHFEENARQIADGRKLINDFKNRKHYRSIPDLKEFSAMERAKGSKLTDEALQLAHKEMLVDLAKQGKITPDNSAVYGNVIARDAVKKTRDAFLRKGKKELSSLESELKEIQTRFRADPQSVSKEEIEKFNSNVSRAKGLRASLYTRKSWNGLQHELKTAEIKEFKAASGDSRPGKTSGPGEVIDRSKIEAKIQKLEKEVESIDPASQEEWDQWDALTDELQKLQKQRDILGEVKQKHEEMGLDPFGQNKKKKIKKETQDDE